MDALKTYGWPGNVRELRNVVERAMLLADGQTLTLGDFPVAAASQARLTEQVDLPAAGIDLEQLERSLVVQALERSGWNQTKAAGDARAESRPDPLSHREVQTRKAGLIESFPAAPGNIPHPFGLPVAEFPAPFRESGISAGGTSVAPRHVMVTTERVEAVLARVRPFMQADGGNIELVGVEGNSAACG